MSSIIEVKQDEIQVVVHDPKKLEKKKATVELLAFYPEVFQDGFLQDVRLDIPTLNPTEAAIVLEAAPIIKQWKDFMKFIFSIYPHDSLVQNMKRIEHLWPHVLLLQGRDSDEQ